MATPKITLPDDDVKKWVDRITLICLSPDFVSLKQELETIYRESGVEDVPATAFSDALYTFLAEKE